MRQLPMFDIFSGRFDDGNAMWVEAVEGLGTAADRMKQLAADNPGPYFVYSTQRRLVVARIDSSAPQSMPVQRLAMPGNRNKN
jgi:hypothetical protein